MLEGLTKFTKLEKILFKIGYYRLTYFLQDIGYEIKYFFQKIFTGHCDRDYWNANYSIAKYALPLIKNLRKNQDCYPTNTKSLKEWQKILDKIIWSMESFLNEDDFKIKKTSELKRFYAKQQEGFRLFGEHFTSLWD